MYSFDDINDQWVFFHTVLEECLNYFLPLRKVYSKKSKRPTPWFSEDISNFIKMKNQAKKKAEWSNLEGDWIIYRACKNTLKSLIRQAKLQFISNSIFCTKSHPHVAAQLWSRINVVLNRSTLPPASFDASIPLDTLNSFFQTVAVTPHHQPARCFVLPDNNISGAGFSFDDISVDTVFRHLSSLDVRKSAGPNGLSARFLKEIAVEIAAPLAHLYNLSLQQGIVPREWKQSHITPVHEGGSTDDPSHYRPIAVVSVVAKVLEKIVATQLSSYLEEHQLLNSHQGAYRHGKGTEDILLVAVDAIVHRMDEKESVCVAFLDLRKAFDSLDHCMLLHQLSNLGVSNAVLRWFQDYLSDRTHRVKCHHQYSAWALMKGGIPQGSALRPLLFLIYMNTLPSVISDALLLQYADDTTLVCSGPDPAATAYIMNQQLALIHDWLVEHRMRLNVQKSRIMWFRAGRCKLQHPYPHVSINGVTLQTTERQTYLGLSFDACFSWDSQVSNICKKMSYYLYLIKSHCKVLKFDIMKLLIESLVFSHLTYAMSVWGSSLKQHLVGRLERLQNRAVRLLFHLLQGIIIVWGGYHFHS